jgi:hypothetical protein
VLHSHNKGDWIYRCPCFSTRPQQYGRRQYGRRTVRLETWSVQRRGEASRRLAPSPPISRLLLGLSVGLLASLLVKQPACAIIFRPLRAIKHISITHVLPSCPRWLVVVALLDFDDGATGLASPDPRDNADDCLGRGPRADDHDKRTR